MQKLIDELKLYPGKDQIPTEIADKILAVYQINNEDIKVNIKPNYLLWQDLQVARNAKLLTVPDGHTYVLKHGFMKVDAGIVVGNRKYEILISDKAGTVIWVIEADTNLTASDLTHWRLSDMSPKTEAVEAEQYYMDKKTAPLPKDFVMLEGWTFKFWDHANVDALDDTEVSIVVEDIEN